MTSSLNRRVSGGSSANRWASMPPAVEPFVARLSRHVEIGGALYEQTARYEAKDATVTDWPAVVGDDLAIASTGADPTVDLLDSLTGGTWDAVRGNAGKYYRQAAGNDFNIGTDDLIFEVVLAAGPTGISVPLGDHAAGTGNPGLGLVQINLSYIAFRFGDSGGLTDINSPALIEGVYRHYLFSIDRDEASVAGGLLYVDGSYHNGADYSSRSGSANSAGAIAILASDGGANDFRGDIAYVGLWHAPNMFPGGAANRTVMDSIASARSA